MQFENGKAISIWGKYIPRTPLKMAMKEYRLLMRPYLKKTGNEIPSIVPYLVTTSQPNSVILIAPGGGYMGRAQHEGKDIALWLNSIGISAFVLNYRHAPFRHPIPFLDAQRAVRFIRYHAQEFKIDPTRLGMLGFSAGGHLTSTICTLTQRSWFLENYCPDEIDRMDDLPNVCILCYPVISLQTMPHEGSRYNLLGKTPNPELMSMLSTETQVNPNTPPTFIWTTKTDAAVAYQNSVMFVESLKKHEIDHEFHLFSDGRHGLGLAYDHPEVSKWPTLCQKWLKYHRFKNYN
jgi:acetyl esterase/lipase